MSEKSIKVVVADDHELIRSGIRKLFEKTPNIVIVGEAANGKEAVELVETLCPDVLLLDIQMPIMDGIEAFNLLCEKKVNIITFIVSGHYDAELVNQMLSKGVWGYYLKDQAPAQIVEAINRAIRGEGKGRHPSIVRPGFSPA